MTNKKAVILLSGGMDSVTCAKFAVDEGWEVHAISFDYGSKLKVELEFAEKAAKEMNLASHRIVNLDFSIFSQSSLTNDEISVPKFSRADDCIDRGTPSTYVPARNTIFLSYALALVESLEADAIFIGVNKMDFKNYPDTRPEYVARFESLAELAIKPRESGKNVTIKTPLINLDKKGIIALGKKLEVDYSLTLSCYEPVGQFACGKCQSCWLRLEGFEQNNLQDPAKYV